MTARLSPKEKARRKREREQKIAIPPERWQPTPLAYQSRPGELSCEEWNDIRSSSPTIEAAMRQVQNRLLDRAERKAAEIPSQANTATEILAKAAEHQAARAATYDSPGGERSMERTVQVFNLVTRRDGAEQNPVTESEGWLFMQLLKDVRDRATKAPHRDSLEDATSYSSLKAEARLREGA